MNITLFSLNALIKGEEEMGDLIKESGMTIFMKIQKINTQTKLDSFYTI